jgi:hypothetical protein
MHLFADRIHFMRAIQLNHGVLLFLFNNQTMVSHFLLSTMIRILFLF